MDILIYLATSGLVVATLLPFSRHSHWLVRGMDFPRLQLASLGAFLLLLQLIFLDLAEPGGWAIITATVLCCAWQLWWILPYTRLWRVEVNASEDIELNRQISILTVNVLTPNHEVRKLISLVEKHQPDVLVTLESDEWWENQLSGLEVSMPETIKCPQDNLYGMHVYSRLPLHEKEISFLVEDSVPSIHAILGMPDGTRVRVHFLHPAPPSPTENLKSAERDAELIIVARSVADSDQPIIVAGDLNDVAWSRTTRLFRKLSGLLDPRVGRGMFNTFHVDYPFLRWPLDHLFHSSHFTVHSIQRLPAIGSDHFPLFTRLSFTPVNAPKQQGLHADGNDEAFAAAVTAAKNADKTDVPEPGLG